MSKEPIQINLEKIPPKFFTERKSTNKQWVMWGENDMTFERLNNLFYNSPTHHGICTKKLHMMLGDEIIIKPSSKKNEIETDKFLNNINRNGETMEEILENVLLDYIIYGMAAVQTIWGKGGNYVSELYHFPMNKLRASVKDKNGMIDKWFYSENWQYWRKKEFEPYPIQSFTTNKDIIAIAPTQMLIFQKYCPGQDYYSYPDYIGALNSIDLDYQISEFCTKYLKNGMFPSVILNYPNCSDEEKDYIVNSLEQQYTGSENTNKFLISFTSDNQKPELKTVTLNNMSQIMQTLSDMATKKILQAHSINPIIAGLSEQGSLGDGKEINNAYLLYENTVIKPEQYIILRQLNHLMKLNQLDEIEFSSTSPIPFQAAEETMRDILKINEFRSQIGYEDITPEEYNDLITIVMEKAKQKSETSPIPPEVVPKTPITPAIKKAKIKTN